MNDGKLTGNFMTEYEERMNALFDQIDIKETSGTPEELTGQEELLVANLVEKTWRYYEEGNRRKNG